MAYGGGFLGGLSEFAGGAVQGIQTEQKMRAEREAAERDKQRFEWEKDEQTKKKTLETLLSQAPKVGEVVGARTQPLFSGASEEEANNFLTGYTPQAPADMSPQAAPQAPQAAPAPQAAAIPTPAVEPAAPPPVQEGASFKEAFSPYEKKAALPPQEPAPQQPAQPEAPAKLTTYYDPIRKTYNVISEADARKATEADVAAYEVAAYRAAGDVKTARALERDGLEMIKLRSEVNREKALLTLDRAMLSSDPMMGLNNALKVLNADDDVTLGANFSVIQTKDGKYTIGAAPDGTGLEPKPLPKNMFGEYKDPAQLFQAVRSVVEGKFGEFQNTVFNQQVSLQELSLRERAQKLSEDKFSFDKMDANRNYGLRVRAQRAAEAKDKQEGIPGYNLKTVKDSEGREILTYVPKKPGGVALVEGPYGEFMPRRYAENPEALARAKAKAKDAGGVDFGFDPSSGDLVFRRANGSVGRIVHTPNKK